MARSKQERTSSLEDDSERVFGTWRAASSRSRVSVRRRRNVNHFHSRQAQAIALKTWLLYVGARDGICSIDELAFAWPWTRWRRTVSVLVCSLPAGVIWGTVFPFDSCWRNAQSRAGRGSGEAGQRGRSSQLHAVPRVSGLLRGHAVVGLSSAGLHGARCIRAIQPLRARQWHCLWH